MVGSSKILTVSYGTFSCTLEGFDDSFETMKAIAEYFRDLAADDRYFGAEPATPDAEMMARIAEREIARRVEARTDGAGIVLRVSNDTRGHDAPLQPSRPAFTPTPGASSEDRAAPSEAVNKRTAQPETTHTAPAHTGTAQANTTQSTINDPFAGDYEDDEGDDLHAPVTAPAAPQGLRHDPESVAAKLQRIRAVVGRSAAARDAAFAQSLDDVPEAELATPNETPDPVSTNSPSHSLDEATASATEQPDMPDSPDLYEIDTAGEYEVETADENATLHRIMSAATRQTLGAGEKTANEEAEPKVAADEQAASPSASPALSQMPTADDVTDDRAATVAIATDTDAADTGAPDGDMADFASIGSDADAHAIFHDTADDVARRDDPAAEITNTDTFPDADDPTGLDAHVAQDAVWEDDATLESDVGTTFENLPQADDATEADAMEPQNWQEDNDALAAQTFAFQEPALQDGAEGQSEPQTATQPDDTDPQADTPQPAVSPRPGRALLNGQPEADEAAMSRIMSETDAQLNEPESSRRRQAIAQLKAAVAATEAARRMGDPMQSEGDSENAFRADLQQVVRPRRAQLSASSADLRGVRPRATPLKLVASQRVDSTAPVSSPEPIRPRRIASEPLAAVQSPTQPDAADSFAAFAARMHATDLPDLLEAAAAYTSFVEGVEDFSRPQIMKKVRDMLPEDFSREDGLRSFGTLLRQGRITKVRNGRFQVSEETRFNPERRAG